MRVRFTSSLFLIFLVSCVSFPRGFAPPSDRFQEAVRYYFDQRMHLAPLCLESYLEQRLFLDLLLSHIDPGQLKFDQRIDYEILKLRLQADVEEFLLWYRYERVWFDILPPFNYRKLILVFGGARLLNFYIQRCKAGIAALIDSGMQKIAPDLAEELLAYCQAFPYRGRLILYPHRSDPLGPTIEAYRRYLAGVKPSADIPAAPTPWERYRYMIKYYLGVDMTPEELKDLARRYFDLTLVELACLADQIEPSKGWRQILEEAKREHPRTPKELLKLARIEAIRACNFVIERGLVSVPREAMGFRVKFGRRVSYPFGYYGNGTYYVPRLKKGLTSEERHQLLRDNNPLWTRIVALHEVIPGHHLQNKVGKRSRVRALGFTGTFTEGWGMYCEEIMKMNGYLDDDPRAKLVQLKFRLWRCARVIISVGLHTKTMTRKDAIRMLVKQVGFEPRSAELEVKRYTESPIYYCTYLIGYLGLMDLRRELERSFPDKFDQRRFHDLILAEGPLPIHLLRQVILRRFNLEGRLVKRAG